MHYLHIFNVCYVTDIVTKERKVYRTKDFDISLKPLFNELYQLTIRTETTHVLTCDCAIDRETETDLVLVGLLDHKPSLKIVMNKSFFL